MDKPLLKPTQVAEHLETSVKMVHQLYSESKLQYVQVNNLNEFWRKSISRKFLENGSDEMQRFSCWKEDQFSEFGQIDEEVK